MSEKTKPSLSKKLSSKEALELAKRPEVEEVLNTRRGWWIIFTTEFQDEVTLRYLRGEKPSIIFRSHNLGPEILGYKRIERCIYHWASHPCDGRASRLEEEHRCYAELRKHWKHIADKGNSGK